MKAIIPAAGIGTRLLPQTYTVPKPLLYVAGKPIIGHILDDLEKIGIDEIGLIVGDKGGKITDYVNSNYSFRLDYVYQEERCGLGHAIYLYLSEKGYRDEPLMIVLSDTIFNADLTKIKDSKYTTIGVHKVDTPKRYGIVELEHGFIKSLVEKPAAPKSNLAIVGVYFIKNVSLLFKSLQYIIQNDVKTKGEYQLTDALQLMVDNGEEIAVFDVDGWHDCGTPETLLQTNRYLLDSISNVPIISGSIIIPPVYISNSAIIDNSIIGPYVSIASSAKVTKSIVEDSIINENSFISNGLIRNSIIGYNAVFDGQFSVLNVGDSSQIAFVK